MANALYDLARQAFLDGDLDWSANDIKVYLIDTADYTVNLATDQFASIIAGAAKVATSGNLAGKTVTNGVADANDFTFTSVTGDPCEAMVIWQDTGNQATSRLIAYIDTATGLPITPNGNNIDVIWDNGANRIFKL
jgi:hypothetical protein